jgi:hypothetical protein
MLRDFHRWYAGSKDFAANLLNLPHFIIFSLIQVDYFISKRLFIVKYFLVFTDQLWYLIDLRDLVHRTDDIFCSSFSPVMFVIWLWLLFFLYIEFVSTDNSPVSRWLATADFNISHYGICLFSWLKALFKNTRISRILFELTHFHWGLFINDQIWGFIY